MGLARPLFACGIDWTLPSTHFDGIDEQGYVSVWKKIDEIDVGSGIKLPININFKSNRDRASPYLGYGWIMPLFESCFIQVGENQFQMIQPDGWIRVFWRDKIGDTVLSGAGGWKAEVFGNVITARAECGWKLIFQNGKISSITTPTTETITYAYEQGAVSQLSVNGKVKAIIKFNASHTLAIGIQSPEKEIKIDFGYKPRFSVSADGTLITDAYDQSVSRFDVNSTAVAAIKYDSLNKKNPRIQIISETEARAMQYIWDLKTRHVLSDDNYNYEISKASGGDKLTRRDKNSGKFEFRLKTQSRLWEGDQNGSIEQIYHDGSYLSGKLRSIISRNAAGKIIDLSTFSYDEKGRISTQKNIAGDVILRYSRKGLIEKCYDGSGNLKVITVFDDKNCPIYRKKENSQEYLLYRENGVVEKYVITSAETMLLRYDDKGISAMLNNIRLPSEIFSSITNIKERINNEIY